MLQPSRRSAALKDAKTVAKVAPISKTVAAAKAVAAKKPVAKPAVAKKPVSARQAAADKLVATVNKAVADFLAATKR